MFVFGIDIPLVELIFLVSIIAVVILIEITVILILLAYQMKKTNKLNNDIKRLTNALLDLEDKELEEIDKLRDLRERKIVSRPGRIRRAARTIITGIKKRKPRTYKPKTRRFNKIVIKKPEKKKGKSGKYHGGVKALLKRVDKFLEKQK